MKLELMTDKKLLLFSTIIGGATAFLFLLIMGVPIEVPTQTQAASLPPPIFPPPPPYSQTTHQSIHS